MPRKLSASNVSGIKPVRNKKTGKVYWYHRATGKALKSDPKSAAGLIEIAGLDAKAAKRSAITRNLAEIIGLFKESPKWKGDPEKKRKGYAKNTRSMWESDFRYLEAGAEEIYPDTLSEDDAIKLIADAEDERGVRAAQLLRSHLIVMCDWARSRKHIARNPFKGVPAPKWEKGQRRRVNRRLALDELLAIFADAQDQPGYLALLAIQLFGGTRVGDAREVLKKQYRGRVIYGEAEKNEAELGIKVGPFLAGIIERAIADAPECPTIAHNAHGRPWTKSGADGAWSRRRTRLEAAGAIRPGATFHGMRHSLASIGRELGASDAAIAGALNNQEPRTAATYARDADRIRLGNELREAIAERLISGGMENALENSAPISIDAEREKRAKA